MKKIKSPISVQFEVTESCNNNCKHCYNPFRFSEKQSGNLENILGIVDKIIEADIFHVVVTGGEPLMIKDIVYDAISRLRKNDVTVSLNSNVTLVDTEIARKLKALNIEGVLTSIFHYNPAVHDEQTQRVGSYQEMARGIEILRAEGLRVGANMVVKKSTVADVYKTGKQAISFGVQSFAATRMAPAYGGRCRDELLSKEDITLVFDQLLALKEEYEIRVASLNPTPLCFSEDGKKYYSLTRRGCGGGSVAATINPEGKIRSCQHGPVEETAPNILKEGVESTWQKIPAYKQEYLPKMCMPCSKKEVCGGGCRESSSVLYGKLNAKDSLAKLPIVKSDRTNPSPLMGYDISFREGLLYRDDLESGGVIFRSPGSFAILNQDEYKLCVGLSKLPTFNVEELARELGSSAQTLIPFFNFLYRKNLVTEGKK